MAQVDVSSSEIPPHPGEVTHDLKRALDKLRRLRDAAIARGDEAGARAWESVSSELVPLVLAVESARAQQTWSAKRTEPCATCKR